jgi:hypothetical protein
MATGIFISYEIANILLLTDLLYRANIGQHSGIDLEYKETRSDEYKGVYSN